jgi:hypothetical protein
MNEKQLNWDIYEKANEFSQRIVDEILKGLKDPTYNISGEARTVYEEINMFKWFEDKPLDLNESFYVKLISMQQYRHLLWKSTHQKTSIKKGNISKWEKVMGAMP